MIKQSYKISSIFALLTAFTLTCCETESITQPDYTFAAVEGDPAIWELVYLSNCTNTFPGTDCFNALSGAFIRSQISYKERIPIANAYNATKSVLTNPSQPSAPGINTCYDAFHCGSSFDDYKQFANSNFPTNVNFSPPLGSEKFRILMYGTGFVDNDGYPDEFVLGASDAANIDGHGIKGLSVVFVDDIHLLKCIKKFSLDDLKHYMIHTTVHEIGHVAMKHSGDVHTSHSGQNDRCCYLKLVDDLSNCIISVDAAGFCRHHVDSIALRRNNSANY